MLHAADERAGAAACIARALRCNTTAINVMVRNGPTARLLTYSSTLHFQ